MSQNHPDHSQLNISNPEFQEAILKVSGILCYEELEFILKESFALTLHNVDDTIVYILSQNTQSAPSLVSTAGMLHTIPKEGILGECVYKKKRIVKELDLPESDPVCGLLKTVPTAKKKYVICSPVIDRENNDVVAVLLAICDEPSKEDLNNLNYLERHIVVCCRRLLRTAQIREHGLQSNRTPDSRDSLVLQLCADLYDPDPADLQVKIVKYLMEQTQSESGFILLNISSQKEMICQAIGANILREEIRIPINLSIFSHSVEKELPMTIADLDKEKLSKLEDMVGMCVSSVLCVPVKRKGDKEVVALACLLNKQNTDYTDADIEIVQHCFKHTATVLYSTLAFQVERHLKNQTQALLQVAKNLFTHLDDLTVLLREIMQEARNLTQAERCSVFLVEQETKELVSKVFDSDVQDAQLQTEVRIPLNQGIAGHVATTGEILNIDDAYSHPLFYRGVDEATGFKTRNILCFPIKDDNDKVIGVAQLCNKIKASRFTSFDEDVAQAFSVYCCISIMHTLMYKTVRESQHRSKLSNELMTYHMQIDPYNVKKFCDAEIPNPTNIDENFCCFSSLPRLLPYDETPLASLVMFEDLSFISKYRIRRETLVKFILMVRKGYRDIPYHNWHHAFSVAHFCYLLFKNVDMSAHLQDLDMFSLLVACFCHDIDHRGTTNSYQMTTDSVLAALYSSQGSVLERHHFAQTMCILNTEGCNIFESLNRRDYEKALDLVRDIILATDIGTHFKILPELEKMARDGYNAKSRHHRHLLLSLLMTSCDLSDQTKNWKIIKQVAELIYKEFFSQGDMEKKLGKAPIAMMDRDKACIPELQIGFLDGVALPVFSILGKLYPTLSCTLETVRKNRQNWQQMAQKANELKLQNNSLDLLQIRIDEDSSV